MGIIIQQFKAHTRVNNDMIGHQQTCTSKTQTPPTHTYTHTRITHKKLTPTNRGAASILLSFQSALPRFASISWTYPKEALGAERPEDTIPPFFAFWGFASLGSSISHFFQRLRLEPRQSKEQALARPCPMSCSGVGNEVRSSLALTSPSLLDRA